MHMYVHVSMCVCVAAKAEHIHDAVDSATCVREAKNLASLTITSCTNGRLPVSQLPYIQSAWYWRRT